MNQTPPYVALAALFLVTACSPANPIAPANVGPGEECQNWSSSTAVAIQPGERDLAITKTTQARIDDFLSIGVGNIWEDDYTPAGGPPTRGLTAGLWLTEPAAPTPNRTIRVHPGEVVAAVAHQIRVAHIHPCGVHLAISSRPV